MNRTEDCETLGATLASGLAFSREAIMADQLISEQVMAIVGNTILVYQAIEHSMKDVARHVDVSVPFTLDLADSKAKAETISKRRQLMAKDLAVCVEKLMMPSLLISTLASDKKHMRPDIDGWVPLQRLLARCEMILGDALNAACGFTQTKGKLDFLKKQMCGFEFKEQKTKNGMRVMYRIPETATPNKIASR